MGKKRKPTTSKRATRSVGVNAGGDIAGRDKIEHHKYYSSEEPRDAKPASPPLHYDILPRSFEIWLNQEIPHVGVWFYAVNYSPVELVLHTFSIPSLFLSGGPNLENIPATREVRVPPHQSELVYCRRSLIDSEAHAIERTQRTNQSNAMFSVITRGSAGRKKLDTDFPSLAAVGWVMGVRSTSTELIHSGEADINSTQQVDVDDVVGRNVAMTNFYEAPAPIVTSLHQLPAPPSDFTGRVEELKDLLAHVADRGATILGLYGMGGVGKTAVALKLAEQLQERYPDAQFYLDLKGASKQPLSVKEALSHVIRAYHPVAQVPDDEDQLRGLYQAILHDQRALLLMDNAVDAWQVEPLIPSEKKCLLIITSRQHFTLPGLYARDLNTLQPNDAHDLLLKIAPRVDRHADAIAQLCGYLPLALRLAGSALAERATLTPENYLKQLADAKGSSQLIDASLSLSYDLLDRTLKQAWCSLAVFPGTFDLAAAAAVWNVGANKAQDQLDALIRYSFVEWDETTIRARLHNLARLFAGQHLDDAERMASRRRHAAHYEQVLRQADGLYQQGQKDMMDGLTVFDLEWANIQSGQAWAVEYAETDDGAAGLCSDYPDAGVYMLHLRQHPRDLIRWQEAALTAARRLKQRDAEGRHLGNLGNAYFSLSEYRRAIDLYEQWLTITRELGDRYGEGAALGNLGIAYASLGEHRRAIDLHKQYLAITREIGDRQGEGTALGNLGNAYYSLGEHRRATELYEQQLEIASKIADRHGEGYALGNLGNAYQALGESGRAIEYHKRHLAIAHEVGDRQGEARASWNLGWAYEQEGDLVAAVAAMQVRVDLEREIGHPDAEKHEAHVEEIRARLQSG